MDQFISFLRSFGLARLAAIIGVGAGVAIALALIALRLGSPDYAVLAADLDYAEAERAIAALEGEGAPFQVRERGGAVALLAPRARLPELRMALARAGAVRREDSVGYEIFDQGGAIGATTFQHNVNRLRALEGELARTIARIEGVRGARVHLVMPERALFERDREEASASIVVDAARPLEESAIRAIVNLAASATPGLRAERVTLLDSRGRLLASGGAADDEGGLAGSIEERKRAAEARLRRDVEALVARIVGVENVRVEIAADMDFSRVTESAEIVDPDSRTVLSSTLIEESARDRNGAIADAVSVANALPGAPDINVVNPEGDGSSSQRLEEVTNYEISKTVRNAVREEGLKINKISVAVAVNEAALGGDEEAGAERLARIATLVRSAIGADEARGDQVSVVAAPFAPVDAAGAGAGAGSFAGDAGDAALDQALIARALEALALLVIAIGLIVFVLRPLFRPGGADAPRIEAAPTPERLSAQTPAQAPVPAPQTTSAAQRISEIVETHGDESANVLRRWIREPA